MRGTARRRAAQDRAISASASLVRRAGRTHARFRLCAPFVIPVAAAAACASGASGPDVRVIDLVRQFAHAETLPVHGSFQIAEHTFGGRAHATLAVPVPSRVIWVVTLPERATLHAAAAVPSPARDRTAVMFRVGVSDDRIYDRLIERTIRSSDTAAAGWVDLQVDLSLYAGWKWSLFYRPGGRRWRVVLSADAVEGTTAALWGDPGIYTDNAAARKFFARDP